MSVRESDHAHLTTERALWLAGSLVLVLVPHVARMPVWISASFLVFMLWRLACRDGRLRLPGRWVRVPLALVTVAAVFATFGTVLGRDAGVALLIVLTGLKLLETRGLRDAHVVCFLGYFLVVTNFLYSQSIPSGLYMLVVVLALTATLIVLNTEPGDLGPAQRLARAATLLGQALPIMLTLFLLFPRINGPLWGLPNDAYGARSGLTDSMAPGAISALSLSDAVAFRVKFDGPAPPSALLYWRGPVLWHTDGHTWSRGAAPRESPAATGLGEPISYTITLEPHQQRWLFALGLPQSIPTHAHLTADLELLARRPVRERMRYHLRSYLRYRDQRLSAHDRQRALELPVGMHPEARALAARWRASARDDQGVVARALAYFAHEPFYYTLHPPPLRGDMVDEFLFGTRRGFCEHYAVAFAVLMRAAGIPTRIVTGYQGGELNPLGDYLIVRQRDAHAWDEVWLGARGWVRVDPTAAVSPTRIERGMEAAIPESVDVAGVALPTTEAMRSVWLNLRRAWDSINNSWNQWVLGYGPSRQYQFLARLGLNAQDWRQLALWLLIGVSLLLAAVGLWLYRRALPDDQVQAAYRQFCAKLARRGLPRAAHEGPVDFARRVCAARPGLAREVDDITERYVRLRYGETERDVRAFRRAVATFRG